MVLKKDSIITAINGTKVNSIDDAQRIYEE